MKKYIGLFIKGFGLGLGIGLCLAGAVGLLYRALRGGEALAHVQYFTTYFFVVGGLIGTMAGWCLSLQMVLGEMLESLFLTVSQLVPLNASQVGEEWAHKMETFFREVLKPLPAFFGKIVDFFLVVRFRDYGKVNRSLEKAKQQKPDGVFTPEWLSMVALHFFLEPLWIFFYLAYAILFVAACVFWSFPFFR
ncbi:MAG TPA: hypothetical protein VIJ93_02955 [bacterium]